MLASLFYTLASCYTNFFKSTRLSSLIRVRVGAAWRGDVRLRAAYLLSWTRACEADGGRIYHKAWCGWGAAWRGDVRVRAADPLS